ncbi:MAG: 50S ribosomal protein L29 [Patescibacteria group bacterium]
MKNKPLTELQKQLKENRDKLWQLKVDLAAGKVKNVQEIKATKKNIAQIMTFINQHLSLGHPELEAKDL